MWANARSRIYLTLSRSRESLCTYQMCTSPAPLQRFKVAIKLFRNHHYIASNITVSLVDTSDLKSYSLTLNYTCSFPARSAGYRDLFLLAFSQGFNTLSPLPLHQYSCRVKFVPCLSTRPKHFSEPIKDILKLLEKASHSADRRSLGFSAAEIAYGLSHVATNDGNKKMV